VGSPSPPNARVANGGRHLDLGALSYFHEAGIRVPQDVPVIGYDDAPAAAYSAPRLTSVHIPWREMTKNGIAELLNLCYGFNRPVTRIFPVSVSLRASVAKVARRRRSISLRDV